MPKHSRTQSFTFFILITSIVVIVWISCAVKSYNIDFEISIKLRPILPPLLVQAALLTPFVAVQEPVAKLPLTDEPEPVTNMLHESKDISTVTGEFTKTTGHLLSIEFGPITTPIGPGKTAGYDFDTGYTPAQLAQFRSMKLEVNASWLISGSLVSSRLPWAPKVVNIIQLIDWSTHMYYGQWPYCDTCGHLASMAWICATVDFWKFAVHSTMLHKCHQNY